MSESQSVNPSSSANASGSHGNVPYDIWRHSLLRYSAYANEVGESFRPLIPRSWVNFSYVIAFGYVFGDTADKTQRTYSRSAHLSAHERYRATAIAGGDALLWQTFASVLIPGLTVNRIVAVSRFFIKRSSASWTQRALPILPTALGLGCIPFIVHPIDRFVDKVMDRTVRTLPAWDHADAQFAQRPATPASPSSLPSTSTSSAHEVNTKQ